MSKSPVYTKADVGVLFDGTFGQVYNDQRTIDLAEAHGFKYERIVQADSMADHEEWIGEIAEDALEYLNTLCVGGISIEWIDGDLMIVDDSENEEN